MLHLKNLIYFLKIKSKLPTPFHNLVLLCLSLVYFNFINYGILRLQGLSVPFILMSCVTQTVEFSISSKGLVSF